MNLNRLALPTLFIVSAAAGAPAALASPTFTGDGDHNFVLKTEMTGADGMYARAKYRDWLHDDDDSRRMLKIEVKDGPAWATMDISYRGDVLAQITLDDDGDANVRFFADDDTSLPMFQEGDLLGIGDLAAPLFLNGKAPRVKLRARLWGDDELKAKATYRERWRKGLLKRRFDVNIEHGTPGSMHGVWVSGSLVGFIALDDEGEGELRFRRDAMPETFPFLQAGDSIRVGEMTSLFAGRSSGHDDAHHEDDDDEMARKLRLRVWMGERDGLFIKARYKERFGKRRLRRLFKVQIHGAEPGDTFPVDVNGVDFGDIIINNEGEGRLRFRDEDAPVLHAGDMITVGAFTGELALIPDD